MGKSVKKGFPFLKFKRYTLGLVVVYDMANTTKKKIHRVKTARISCFPKKIYAYTKGNGQGYRG